MYRNLTTGLLLAILVGCASSPQRPREILDAQTSVMITYSSTSMLLYRDVPAHAAHAKNMVSLGPLQVNQSGHYRYFLWLGIWNTNYKASEAGGRDGFDSIILFVDGEPLALEISGWTPSAIGASAPVYPQPVASALNAFYEVTADQIRFIAESNELSLLTSGFTTLPYEQWDEQLSAKQGFRTFLTVAY